MKLLSISISLFLLLGISCSKKVDKIQDTELKTQSEVEVIHTKLKEFSQKETSELLKTENDTLYITNFFATWCRPCVMEIPYFKEEMEEMKQQPVKFTFVNLDKKSDWETEVSKFVDQMGIRDHTILLDGELLEDNFFISNFKDWKGEYIPYTFMRKGNKTREIAGSISKERLVSEINSFQ